MNLKNASTLEQSRKFIPPTLATALENLENGFNNFQKNVQSQAYLKGLLYSFAGRPTPLTHAKNLSEKWGGEIFLKREDLVHGGAHKLNSALGQCVLAKEMGFTQIIAETGAGQHGVATAIAAAKLGLKAKIFQGATDVERQRLNVLRMRLLGAEVISVNDGNGTLKEAVNAAMREWVSCYKSTAYCLGSVVGPHPYPTMVRSFQKIIGEECRLQLLELHQKLPDAVFACVGGGSNAAGIFSGFTDDTTVKLIACEASQAASLTNGSMGVLHGMESYLLQTAERQIAETHSISAGLDYPGVGPWLAGLHLDGRLDAMAITDEECVSALKELATTEGILCALETAHALAALKKFLKLHAGALCIANISGRGDKDLDILASSLISGETQL